MRGARLLGGAGFRRPRARRGFLGSAGDDLDPDTRLALANAIYFKGSWVYKFEKSQTENGPFALPNGDDVTVPMMR
jgi:serpin B